MGAGNWIPSLYRDESGALPDYEMVYVDNDGIYADVSRQSEFDFEDFNEIVLRKLPKSFYPVRQWKNEYGFSDSMYIIAENGLMYLVGADNESSTALAFIPKEDAPAFKVGMMRKVAKKVFDQLADIYDLRVRTSAWTSGEYVKQ